MLSKKSDSNPLLSQQGHRFGVLYWEIAGVGGPYKGGVWKGDCQTPWGRVSVGGSADASWGHRGEVSAPAMRRVGERRDASSRSLNYTHITRESSISTGFFRTIRQLLWR